MLVFWLGYRWFRYALGGGKLQRADVRPVAVKAYEEAMADVFCVVVTLAGEAGVQLGTRLRESSVRGRDSIRIVREGSSTKAGAWQHMRCWDDRCAPREIATRRAEHRLRALEPVAAPKGPTSERGYRQGIEGLTAIVLVVMAGFEIPDIGDAPSPESLMETLDLLFAAAGADVAADIAVHGPLLEEDLNVLQPRLLPVRAR